MCGICGQYKFDGKPVAEDSIRSMCAVMKHRGPDDQGTHLDGPLGMGMRRLSIIDLSTGHQPISNEDNTIWTVLNGEIYNYEELTEELLKKGHVFLTKSDTEVLVHLYEEYGKNFVRLLRGMFGFAIWDKKKRELILARDPLGIKQLYFLKERNTFLFGSEIKCILRAMEGARKTNAEAFSHYITFLYLPDNLTIYEGIEKIRPGCILTINQNGIKSEEYWNLNMSREADITLPEAQKRLMELMEESISLHLRSDVPLGVFLSGGVDSSIITALASRITDKPLNTFTVGYGKEGDFYDERPYARLIAKQFKTNHQEYIITPDIEDAIHKLIYYFDEPFANSSAIPNYYISQAMRQSVKVALSGLGGDEVAGGYERYAGVKLLSYLSNAPKAFKNMAMAIASFLPDSKNGNYIADRCKRFIKASLQTAPRAYYSLISGLSDEKKERILSLRTNGNITPNGSFLLFNRLMSGSNQNDSLRAAMYFDIVSYMTNDLLVLADRTSMANSLEVRVPFLDHKLAEFMYQLPSSFKIRGLQKKYLLKKTFKGVLPDSILFRKKRGFSTPLSVWLRKDLRQFTGRVFTRKRIEATGVLDYSGVQSLLAEHLSRRANNQGILFSLLTFVLWHERYIQQDAAASGTEGLQKP